MSDEASLMLRIRTWARDRGGYARVQRDTTERAALRRYESYTGWLVDARALSADPALQRRLAEAAAETFRATAGRAL